MKAKSTTQVPAAKCLPALVHERVAASADSTEAGLRAGALVGTVRGMSAREDERRRGSHRVRMGSAWCRKRAKALQMHVSRFAARVGRGP
jgi:hypothetical protein